MDIILYKNNLYNNKEFIDTVKTNQDVKGVLLDVTITKDNKIIVFSKVTNNKVTINNIQNSNLNDINYLNTFTLEETLNLLEGFKGKVIINMLPLSEAILIQEIDKLVESNINYANTVYNLFKKYPNLNLYICSTSYNLLYHVNRIFINYKKGVLLSPDSGSYIDTDFYIFIADMLNEEIMLEQLKINKEVMILMEDCSDTGKVISYFENRKSRSLFQYITPHPIVFYNAFKSIEENL